VEPDDGLQLSVFAAAVAAGPAASVADEKSVAEYFRVHCSAAGESLDESAMLRSSVTVDPAAAEPEFRLSATCA
jgi:hypothetical protein